jgi:hypothetical protein
MTQLTQIMIDLQEARRQLDAVRSAMADPLKRWSSEPHRREVVPEVVAALSELIRREAVYQGLLEQMVLELGERMVSFSEERETMTREEPGGD